MGLDVELPPLGEGLGRGLHKLRQRCKCCDSPAQGLRAKHATLCPPHQPCNAVSVAISRRRYPQGKIIKCSKPENVPSWEIYHKI